MEINRFELNRQLFHIALGICLASLLFFDAISREFLLYVLMIGILISISRVKYKLALVDYFLKKFEREKDIMFFPGKGVIFYLLGSYLSLLFFPKDIALASIMVLAFGDSVSHLLGLHLGKMRNPVSKTKFFEGTIAGFIAGFLGALIFVKWHEAFFASLIAMTIEAIDIKLGSRQVDDNLVIPIVSGAVILIVRSIIS